MTTGPGAKTAIATQPTWIERLCYLLRGQRRSKAGTYRPGPTPCSRR
ncbi:hypothetical protein SMICM17S_08103 [Streptomyces microflavus]